MVVHPEILLVGMGGKLQSFPTIKVAFIRVMRACRYNIVMQHDYVACVCSFSMPKIRECPLRSFVNLLETRNGIALCSRLNACDCVIVRRTLDTHYKSVRFVVYDYHVS